MTIGYKIYKGKDMIDDLANFHAKTKAQQWEIETFFCGFGFLFLDYKQKNYYFETMVHFRKIMIIFSAEFLRNSSSEK